MLRIYQLVLLGILIFISACGEEQDQDAGVEEVAIYHAEKQLSLLLEDAYAFDKNPRTINEKGEIHWATHDNGSFDWTLGFFPGTCWYMYEITKDEKWKSGAEKFQAMHEHFKSMNSSHDLGFVFNCSYGNAYRLTHNEAYKQVMIDAGNSLIERFNPQVGCIKSWDVDGGWQARRGWRFPVIIDNMMNLELLFELSEITKDPKYKNIAIAHADATMKNHFRDDHSSFHVVDYDPQTGVVRNRQTAQGYAHESSWARGQAWGLYGFVVCYRYTKDRKYLKLAKSIADYIISNGAMPKDLVPYWDYNAPRIPNEPRDVSAAAITASALVELDSYSRGNYKKVAHQIIKSLSSEEYTAKVDENCHFVLMHSVGSIPHNAEIDVPLNYADYYYIEALSRILKSDILKNNAVLSAGV